MGLFDRLKKKPVNFAEGTSISKLPSGGGAEIGVAGESFSAMFKDEEARTDNIKVSDYVKMRQKDGTIQSLYNIMTLPILSTAYSFAPDEEDGQGEQADFIEAALDNPPHKGGMEIPFSIVKADMLRAVLEGFRVYERVYMLNDQGQVVYRKLAPRDGSKSDQSIVLKRTENGDFNGFHQRVSYQGDFKDVQVPGWKSFLFTYGKDKNFLYGESAFKPAYFHYDLKHRLYYLANLGVQVGAVPPKIVTGPEDLKGAKKSGLLREIDKLGVRTTAYLPDGYTLEAYKAAEGRIDPMPLIDHHDTQMARSVLAQFLMLGTTSGSKGGSHALSSDQSDLFIIALKGVMSLIEDHINYYVIPDLIDLNFAEPHYPTFHFEDITSDVKTLVTNAFSALVTAGGISDVMKRALEDRVAETLDIDRDAVQQELDEEAKQKIADAKAKGLEVDAQGNPLPVAPPVDPAANPQDPKQPAKHEKPSDGQVVNQSDRAADDDPKVSTSAQADGIGHSHRPRTALTLLR